MTFVFSHLWEISSMHFREYQFIFLWEYYYEEIFSDSIFNSNDFNNWIIAPPTPARLESPLGFILIYRVYLVVLRDDSFLGSGEYINKIHINNKLPSDWYTILIHYHSSVLVMNLLIAEQHLKLSLVSKSCTVASCSAEFLKRIQNCSQLEQIWSRKDLCVWMCFMIFIEEFLH